MRRAHLPVALGLAAAFGCTVTTERAGPRAAFDAGDFGLGMRAESVVEALGVPDDVDARLQGFGFVYRFVRRNEERIQIGSYGFKLATTERADLQEGSLELFFDDAGRLVGSRMREGAAPGAD